MQIIISLIYEMSVLYEVDTGLWYGTFSFQWLNDILCI